MSLAEGGCDCVLESLRFSRYTHGGSVEFTPQSLYMDGLLHGRYTRLKEHVEQVWTGRTHHTPSVADGTSGGLDADASTVCVHVAVSPATRRFIDKHRPVIVLFN